ncbi:HTH-type transcriptional regulator BetI [Mycolicibacterium aubagnense]
MQGLLWKGCQQQPAQLAIGFSRLLLNDGPIGRCPYGETKVQTRQRKLPSERRSEIVAVASRLAGETGFGSVTLRQVARAAGVTPGLVSHYFPTVELLLAEAFEQAMTFQMRDMFETVRKHEASVDRMRMFLQLNLDEQRDSQYLLWAHACLLGRDQPLLRDVVIRFLDTWDDELEKVIREGIDSGDFHPHDARKAAVHISALLDSFASHVISFSRSRLGILSEMVIDASERELGLASGTLKLS